MNCQWMMKSVLFNHSSSVSFNVNCDVGSTSSWKTPTPMPIGHSCNSSYGISS
jgi:hypothetical protein